MKEVVIIVDPFSSGVAYAPEFTRLGYDCIAVRSSATISTRMAKGFQPGFFLEQRLFDIDAALERFADRRIKAVVAGCEMGVAQAEGLAARVGVPGNLPDTTRLRRFKFDMQRALADAGLAHIPSTLLRDESEFEGLIVQLDERAYVVKPLNSASTDGVKFAQGRSGVADALARCAWGKINDLGERNGGFVVQPFVQGAEYVVDLVAHEGAYAVASVCRYRKETRNGSSFVYAGLDALDPHDPQLARLIDYALHAARALGLHVGPLHMELLDSPDGPVMIEAGARLHGGVAPELFRDCYQPHLLELSVDAYLGKPLSAMRSRLTEHGHIVFLANDTSATFAGASEAFLSRLRGLRTYRGHKLFVTEGDTLPTTVDLATCPGIVWLVGEDMQQIEADARSCRSLILDTTYASQ
jgi:biotin carboxylase